ncbi:MAG TPA: aromatic acid exporter family protein [Mycobacteriales bacterium]|nr:aromatic acid exporter family protein [Mycobacteriales bacterium]
MDGWLANARRGWHQIRARGLRGWLTLERNTVRQVAKTALAATIAWELARVVLGSPVPALAALGAIITVQITVRQTVARGLQQVVGVVVGVGAAIMLARYLGVHAWSVALVILAALLLGRLLRLGPQANQVAISGLLVLSLGTGYGAARIWDTLLGAVIGVVVNMLIAPPTYVEAAAAALRGVGADLGLLLTEIGAALCRGGWDDRTARGWLDRARTLNRDQRAATAAVEQADESVQFNPRARAVAESVARLVEAALALEHATTQTGGIARTLLELSQDGGPARSVAADRALARYGELLSVVGTVAAGFGRLQSGSAGDQARVARAELVRAHAAGIANRNLVEQALADIPPTDALAGRTLAAVLVDADRLLHELDPDHGAHTAAVPPA